MTILSIDLDCATGVVTELEVPAPPPPVPAAVSPLQIRRALRQAGLRAAVDAVVAGSDEEAVEAWEYATEILRNDAMLLAAADALGLDAVAVDNLFRLAVTL